MNFKIVNVKSIRSFHHVSLSGHSVNIEAGKANPVPAILLPELMAKGCALCNENDLELAVKDDVAQARVEFVGDLRKQIIFLAIKRLVADNDKDSFDAGNFVKAAAIKGVVGFHVDNKEAVALHQKYMDSEKNGTPFDVSAEAVNAMRVIEAGDTAELTKLLVDEFAVCKPEELVGKSLKDARRLGLHKLAGV